MIVHIVQKTYGIDDLQIKLDNAANRGWILVSVQESAHKKELFYVIHKKESNDD